MSVWPVWVFASGPQFDLDISAGGTPSLQARPRSLCAQLRFVHPFSELAMSVSGCHGLEWDRIRIPAQELSKAREVRICFAPPADRKAASAPPRPTPPRARARPPRLWTEAIAEADGAWKSRCGRLVGRAAKRTPPGRGERRGGSEEEWSCLFGG